MARRQANKQPIEYTVQRLKAVQGACERAIDTVIEQHGRTERVFISDEYQRLLWIHTTCKVWSLRIAYWHLQAKGHNVTLRTTLEWMDEEIQGEMRLSLQKDDSQRAARRAKVYVLHGIRQAWAEIVGAERIRSHLETMPAAPV